MRKIVFSLIFILGIQFSNAQSLHKYGNNVGSWYQLAADVKVHKRIGFHAEVQIRQSDFLKTNSQIFVRPGINFYINDKMFIQASYLYLRTNPYGAFPAASWYPENAIWESFNIKNQYGILEWVGRAQFEQRFINKPTLQDGTYKPGPMVYSNRFRMLNRFSIPFWGKKIVDNSVYITSFDELFINFGKNVAANIFDQNRAYIALGYKIPHVGRLEAGYMFQSILKSDGVKIENNHLFMLGINANFDVSKKAKTVNNATKL